MNALKMPDLGRMRLAIELAYWRLGWRLPVIGLGLVACIATWGFWLPMQSSRQASAQRQLATVQSELRARPLGRTQESALGVFQRTLAEPDQITGQLRVLYRMAQAHGLNVAQIDMRRQSDPGARLAQLQISLALAW
ncbi:MAG: hypothetical protein CGU28_14560 [Candidatus Dactylopiibacterium carminicum]|uniref:Uncharacterized protein n=1 Tax=Candidatus Dactylopiibacterium carminicum TaxID=857335 RepID=A0A272ER57_9RHOO|nr:hypothetical protein [Candidatus Dactylopiibacterium carminicum]KAF7598755.1 hypothetical protein BGI27_11495 [Candidatus Dactylopiibacterium carminicum]PAS92593.1 MAG: hypothetical protein CGU29_10925 [Candidatus Dactylopiibacterium carminicum]PAS93893.1 MAG: hypothetical protein CGU28_14560 [Candidatus Dactylopiibacterium carminicum]PAS98776.1 MAG: hypothetical protein BSR46_11510 [Candidatus Dactylopiibacterium carminicum]